MENKQNSKEPPKETLITLVKNNIDESKPIQTIANDDRDENPFKPDNIEKAETTREKEDSSTKLPAISFNKTSFNKDKSR